METKSAPESGSSVHSRNASAAASASFPTSEASSEKAPLPRVITRSPPAKASGVEAERARAQSRLNLKRTGARLGASWEARVENAFS
eukprot:4981356-Prymnesium_polylepis.1